MKNYRILILNEKDFITDTVSIKYKVILPPPPLYEYSSCASDRLCVVIFNCLISSNANTPNTEKPDVSLSIVLLFTIFIIVTQKLVLQQSKNVTAKCTETPSPPSCILYLLDILHLQFCRAACKRLLIYTATAVNLVFNYHLLILLLHNTIQHAVLNPEPKLYLSRNG